MNLDGLTPPHDLDAEMATLGGMLLHRSAIEDVMDVVEARDFYAPKHDIVFTAIVDLYADNEPVDAVTVAALLTRRGQLAKVGGHAYLHTLMESVSTAANAGYHAESVQEHALLRGIGSAGIRMVQMSTATAREDAAEILDRAQADVLALSRRKDQDEGGSNLDSLERVMTALEEQTAPGLPTGFRDFDQLTDGLHPGQMIVVAARPGQGKSTLALDCHRHASIHNGQHTLMFSLEMSHDEITKRILSAEARIPLHHLRYNAMTDTDWARLAKKLSSVASAPLHIIDDADLTLMQIRARARQHARRHPLKLITVDYLQLITGGSRYKGNRQQEVSEISRGLKLMAKELHVPVIAVAQLNRGPEQRADKRPSMSDLRESGAIEQDADLVVLIHRESAYEPESPRAGEADLLIPKHRNGPQATLTVAFQGHYARFVDMGEAHPPAAWSPHDAVGGAQ